MVSTSPKRFLIGGRNNIAKQMNVIYNALIIISTNISLLIMLACLGIGLSFMYSFKAGSLPNAIAARVSIARLISKS